MQKKNGSIEGKFIYKQHENNFLFLLLQMHLLSMLKVKMS